MDSIKEDIHQELHRLRLDKKHLYTTLLKIIDAIPQETPEPVAEVPVVEEVQPEAPTVVEVPVVAKVEEVQPEAPTVVEVPPTPTVKKSGGRKKKVTLGV